MTDAHFDALVEMMSRTTNFLIDMIGGVILACNERDAIEIEKLRTVLDDLASRPDVSRTERAMVERLLQLVP
jgi:hypothetical protein